MYIFIYIYIYIYYIYIYYIYVLYIYIILYIYGLKVEKLINDESNDNLVETVFPRKNQSKDLVNVIGDLVTVIWQWVIRQNARKKNLKVRMVRMLPLI